MSRIASHSSSLFSLWCVPGTLLLATFLGAFHWHFYPGQRLPLSYAVIFHWVLYYPDRMKIGLLLAIAFIQDCLVGLPLGFSLIEFWLVWWLALGQRSYLWNKGFSLVWAGFCLIATGVFAVRVVLCFLYGGINPALLPIVYDWLMTLLSYPLLSMGMIHVQRWGEGR